MSTRLIRLDVSVPFAQRPDLRDQVDPPQPDEYRRSEFDEWAVGYASSRQGDVELCVLDSSEAGGV